MRFLIADDHPIIVVALSEMLEGKFGAACEIETVDTGELVLERVGRDAFDCLVLDLDMPGRPRSVALLAAAKEIRPGLRVAVYTGHLHACLALAAMERGAAAYISKTSGPRLALDAIQRVAVEGGTFVDPSIDLEAARKHPWSSLTASERSILLSLARGENLQALAIDSQRSYKTVTAHKYNAIRKLGLRSNTEIGPFLARHGLDYLLDA